LSQSNFDSSNPYQAPPPTAPVVAPEPTNNELLEMLKNFRSQIVALGAFWIFIGVMWCILGLVLTGLIATSVGPRVEGGVLLGNVLVALGLAWVVLGIMACLKQIWTVYVGLGLSYLSLLGNLLNFNLCGLVILIVVIVQAHRVIGWAGKLTRVGIPLEALPDEPLQSRSGLS
jgi:hypothetical protein